MSESSATKWAVGCLVAGILCLFACGGAVVWMTGTLFRAGRDIAQEAQREMDRQARLMQEASSWDLAAGWSPPAEDAPDDALLPLQPGEWERMFQATVPEIPAVGIEREAISGVYATDGQSLDVYVCRVAADEKDAVFDEADIVINESGVGHTSMSSDDGTTRTLFYQTWGDWEEEQGSGWLVWNGGWLFVVQADNTQTPIGAFLTAYFAEVDANRPVEDAAGATSESGGLDENAEPDEAPSDSENAEFESSSAVAP